MLRITGGEFRGRVIATTRSHKTRPTLSQLRQALFNSLQADTPGASVLDLFAGSGALGFEALSRGAAHVTFVDRAAEALRVIEKNAKDLRVMDRIEILPLSLEKPRGLLGKLGAASFDLVLMDPPYREGWEKRMLLEIPWEKLLRLEGKVVVEWAPEKQQESALPDEFPFLVKVREKKYGETVLTTYVRR